MQVASNLILRYTEVYFSSLPARMGMVAGVSAVLAQVIFSTDAEQQVEATQNT